MPIKYLLKKYHNKFYNIKATLLILLFFYQIACIKKLYANDAQIDVIQNQKQLETTQENNEEENNLKQEEDEIKDYKQNDQEDDKNSGTAKIMLKKISQKISNKVNDINNKSIIKKTKLALNYDNLDNERFGRNRLSIGINSNNIIGLGENISLSTTTNTSSIDNVHLKSLLPHNINNDKSHQFNINNNLEITIPHNDYQFSYHKQQQNYQFYNQDNSQLNTGTIDNNRFSIRKMAIKLENYKLFLRSSFLARNSNNNINHNQKDFNNSFNSNIASFGISQLITSTNHDDFYNELFIKPNYSRGLKILGAREDRKYQNRQNDNQFNLFGIYINYRLRYNLKHIAKFLGNVRTEQKPLNIGYNLAINGQLSKNNLYGNDKISIGGFSSVRGVHSNSIAGNSGFFIRNEASFKLSELLLNIKNSHKSTYSGDMNIGPFFDYGFVNDKSSGGYLSGIGFILNNNIKHNNRQIRLDLTISKLLINNKDLSSANQRNNNYVAYFNIAIDFGNNVISNP